MLLPLPPHAQPKSIEERVLREVFALYKEPSMVSKACGNVGIEAMSRHVGREQLHPSKKITVMIVGNHSAGAARAPRPSRALGMLPCPP